MTSTGRHLSYTCYSLLITLFLSNLTPVTGSPPPAPLGVKVTLVGGNFLVQWDPSPDISGPILHYQLMFHILPDSTPITMTTSGETFALIPISEHSGRLYRIAVFAENSEGLSRSSKPRYIRVECGGNKYISPESTLTVTSNFYPKRIEPNSLCAWKISTNMSYVIGLYIDDFDIRNGSCTQNYITLSDPEVNPTKLCGSKGRIFVSRSNITEVKLHTGSQSSGKGIKITLRSLVPVPGPPSNVRVSVTGSAIRVNWAPPVDYNTDHITAYRIHYTVLPSSRTMVLTLSSLRQYHVISTKGHEGQLYVVKVSALHQLQEGPTSRPKYVRAQCSTEIFLETSDHINVTSPGYPRHYSPLIVCNWKIVSGSGQPFYFRLAKMEVEESLYCNSDYVSVSAWGNNRRCGNISTPEQFVEVSGTLRVKFVSDQKHQYSGFLMEIKSVKNTDRPNYDIPWSTFSTNDVTTKSVTVPTSEAVGSTTKRVTAEPSFTEAANSTSPNITTETQFTEANISGVFSTFTQTISSDAVTGISISSSKNQSFRSSISSSFLSSSTTTKYTDEQFSTLNQNISSIKTQMVSTAVPPLINSVPQGLFSEQRTMPSSVPTEVLPPLQGTHSEKSTKSSPLSGDSTGRQIAVTTPTEHYPNPATSASFYEPSIGKNATQSIGIYLQLKRRTEKGAVTDGDKVEQALLLKLIRVFNTSSLFNGLKILKFGTIRRTPVPVSIVVNYNVIRLIEIMNRDVTFHLIDYVNKTCLHELAGNTTITENWKVDASYLKIFRSAPVFANQEIRNVCAIVGKFCDDSFICVPRISASLGHVCCNTTSGTNCSTCQPEGHKCVEHSTVSEDTQSHQENPSTTHKGSDSFPTTIVLATVGAIFVLATSSVVMLVFRRQKHRKVYISQVQRHPISVHDILRHSHLTENKDIFCFDKANRTHLYRTTSLPSKVNARKIQGEEVIRQGMDRLGLFIEDTATLEKRLRQKRALQRGNSI